MSKKFRNPATGEIIVLEEEGETTDSATAKKPFPSPKPKKPDGDGSESDAEKKPESAGESASNETSGRFRTPFDFLDEIDGKDVERLVLGAALGIGGVFAVKGLCALLGRD
jgi:hypothetical protein